ncbi:hypothetical protein [Streptomyces sp. KO7888]|uniref:hypothetical protein n=1 Tax=Streptomyces sp. KO7888 TaxID=2602737 RepID=UPI001A9974C9|nr:hypothetical protein [Streptomyces sp. KO7888]
MDVEHDDPYAHGLHRGLNTTHTTLHGNFFPYTPQTTTSENTSDTDTTLPTNQEEATQPDTTPTQTSPTGPTGPTVKGLTIEPGDAVLKIPSYETGLLEGALTQEYGKPLPDPADLKPGGKLIIIGHGHQLGDGQKAATEIQNFYGNTLPAGTHIHMIVCQAGAGAYPPAQRLADKLNTPVVASTIDVTMNNLFDEEHYMDVEHDDPYAHGLHRGLNTTHTTLHGNFFPYTPQTTTSENTSDTDTTLPTNQDEAFGLNALAEKDDSYAHGLNTTHTTLHGNFFPPLPPPPPADPPAASSPQGRIFVRPAQHGQTGTGRNGSTVPTGDPVVIATDGRTVPVAQLRFWVQESAKPQPGHPVQRLTISHSPAEDRTAGGADRRELLGQDTFRSVRTTPGDPGAGPTPDSPRPRVVFTSARSPLPGSGTESGADYFVGHGTPRTLTFGSHDGAYPTVTVNGVQAGEVLKLSGGDGPLVLYSCKTGRQPEVAGLPVAQHVANRTGRPVWAPTTEPGTVRDKHGNVQAVLVEGPDGPGEWRLFTPEPSGPDLDRLARDIGLHSGPEPVDAFAQARTLQQVRALREILGPDAEQRPENRDLLAGLAFVDGLRWLDPDTAARYGDGRMTPDLLRRMVTGRHAATGGTAADPGADPTVEQYTDFLRDAAGLRGTAESGTARDTLLPPPPPALPPTTLVAPEDVQGLGYAPSARITWSLSSTPLPLSELTLSSGDLTELARRRPDLVPVADGTGSVVEDPRDTDGVTTPSNPPVVVHANGTAHMRLTTPGDGNCLFRALLDSARGQDIPPAWASRNVAGLRDLLADRLTGSELAAAAAEATPDPVLAVVDDLRMDALSGVEDPAGRQRITEHWNEIAQAVVTDGDPREWQRILVESGYPHLAALAPTPADARRIGSEQLIVTAARLPELWASPFSDLLPQALAHTLDLDLRLVQPDRQSPGSTLVTSLHPGGRGGTLHLDYNGTDHYSALVPFPPVRTSAAASPGESDPFGQWLHDIAGIPDLFGPEPQETLRQWLHDMAGTPDLYGPEPQETLRQWLHDMAGTPDLYGPEPQETLRQWLHDMAGVTDLPAPATQRPSPFTQWLQDLGGTPDLFGPDPDERVPLETRLERNRPAQLLTGPDVSPPRPAPRTVTFADGSALPSVLISPQSGPRDGDPDGTQSPPTGLLTGPGVLTLRSPGQVAQQILGQLPSKLRSQFDEAELLRLLTEQPSAFTAPRGALLVGREKSGVGHEMRVEAIPYHHWKRLSDADGSTVKLDTTRRGQAGTGVGGSVGTGRRIAGALGLGPPLNWILKISASLGWTRRTDYALGTQTYHQSESREPDGSHLHLDDVYYQVRVDRLVQPRRRLTKRPGTVGQDPPPAGPPQSGPVTDRNNPVPGRPDGPPPPEPRWQRSQVHSAAFAVRDGLTWRLPDALTVPFKGPRRAPKTLTFPDGREPRVSDTTGLHLVDPPEDLVLALSGARPGSSAHRRLVSFVQPAQLLPLFGRFAGPVSGPEVTRGSRQHPLGHLVVERSIPHRATLATESIGTEVRELTQTTYQNQRGHVRDTRFGIQVSSGPNGTVVGPETDIRIQGGPVVRADLGTGRSHGLGNDAARKTTAQVRERPVALYQVERTLMVRKAGEPASKARPVRVVTLDWMSTQDARRLAGWDSRTPGRTGPNPDAEPPVPWYLTPEDPVHLGGQVRAEGFRPDRPRQDAAGQPIPEDPQSPRTPQHPLRVFADSVLETLHQSYPSMFLSPWALRHPRLAGLWYGDGRIRTALHNERQVREALNRPTLAQSLDDLTTTGVPVALTEDGTVRRGHHVLVLRARLTDRRFETTLSERAMRNAVIGTEVSGQGQQADTTLSAGIEVGVSPRTHGKVAEPAFRENTGNVAVGGHYAHTIQKATRSGVAVTHDHLSFQESSDLYSYRVELDATFEGHRRPRGWARLVSVGLLGTGYFVSKVAERPLFHGDSQAVGRVELAVPAAHGSAHHGPVNGPPRAPAPAPEQLSSADADHLLDGTRRPTAEGSADRELAHHLLSAPHVVLGVEGSGQRQQLMQDTADRATGDSWHVNAPGARAGTALRRAVANLGVAAQLGQYLGPFGSRVSGLVGAGPFRTHHLKGAVRGELHNLRVKSDPRRSGLEATLGTEHRLVGGASSGSRVTVGVQGADRPLQQPPGQPVAAGSYTAGLQYSHGRTSQVTQTLTPGRNTALKFTGRMYLVVADVMETIAVRDRWTAAFGAVGTRAGNAISSAAGRFSRRLADGLVPRRAAAAVQQIRDAVMFHLPMQDVIGAGLAPDGLGTSTPRNLGGGYRMPSFLGGRPLPAHPSGQLDASAVARELLPRLEDIGVPSHDREQVLQRLSPDFLRANRQELTTDGMPLPIRYRSWSSPHHLPVGGSPGQVRIRLFPVTTTVERLRTGFEFEDIRATARDDAQGEAQQSGAQLSLGVGARTQGGVLAANPSLQGTAAGQWSSTSGQSAGHASLPSMATTQTHAETITSYRLTVTTTDVSGEEIVPPVTAPVGSLNEFVPTSLLTPGGDGDDGTLTEQAVPEPERAVRMLPAPQARPEGVAVWRTSSDSGTTDRGGADPDILPFDDRIGSGIVAVDIIGASNVGDALTLATARADGFADNDSGKRHTGVALTERLRMARFTPLTGLGTAAAQLQQGATGQTGLTSNFRQALGANGSALPVQASADLLGQFHTADSRLYAKMHRHGARLLAVEHKPKMDGSRRSKTSDAHEAGIADNVEGTVGPGPLVSTSGAGLMTAGTTVPIAGTNDGIGQKGTVDTTLADHVKVAPDRSMLFALPVSWLAVAEVGHRITDNKMLHALGKPVRGPRAAEAETAALVWLREDIARDYGLLDDATFPDEVGKAWDDVAEAAGDLTAAEQGYYEARARAREAWLGLSPEEQAALGEDGSGRTNLPPDMAKSPAVVSWQAADGEVRRWELRTDAAASEHHRLQLHASRVTAHHQNRESVPAPGPSRKHSVPAWRSGAPAPYRITGGGDSGPRALISPDGATVREVHGVPHDGASFFHALLAAAEARGRLPHLLGTDLADRLTNAHGDPEVVAEAVGAARDRLACALGADGNEDLLDALALDVSDTFGQGELDAAGVELTPAQQAEFDAFGRLPETFWPNPAQRVALATAALSRPFASEPRQDDSPPPDGEPAPPERRAGDHGGADLLPALAARVLGTPLTVVTGEGLAQLFLPHGGDPATVDPIADPVLFTADGFFHAALPPGTPAPVIAHAPAGTARDTRTGATDTSPPTLPVPSRGPRDRDSTSLPSPGDPLVLSGDEPALGLSTLTGPDAQSVSQMHEVVARLVHRSKIYNQVKASHLAALNMRDYRRGKYPDAVLQYALGIQSELQNIETLADTDHEARQWCTQNASYLQQANSQIAADIMMLSEQTQNYAYFLMCHFGSLWNEPEARGIAFTGNYADYFSSISSNTLHSLDHDPAVTRARERHAGSGGTDSAWVDQKRAEIEAALRQCVLRHYSPAERVQKILGPTRTPNPNPALKSLALLEEEVPGLQHNTDAFDSSVLANHGFVFFYIESLQAGFRGSRFGGDTPARITLPISALEQGNGWVMLNDFLDREMPTLRANKQGQLISYVRKPDDDLNDDLYVLGDPNNFPSVPTKSPEGKLRRSVHEIKMLHLNAEVLVLEMAAAAARAARLAEKVDDVPSMVGAMRQLLAKEDALRADLKNIDHEELNKLKQQREEALKESKDYFRKVRIYRPGKAVAETGHTHYEGLVFNDVRPEPVVSNLLVGRDVIPGLAQRAVVEIARMEMTRPDLARRLKGMTGEALVRFLLKDLVRPQAMLQREVPFTHSDVEFQNPPATTTNEGAHKWTADTSSSFPPAPSQDAQHEDHTSSPSPPPSPSISDFLASSDSEEAAEEEAFELSTLTGANHVVHQGPWSVPPSQVYDAVNRLNIRSILYSQKKIAHLAALQEGDYEQGKHPHSALQAARGFQNELKRIESLANTDHGVRQWCIHHASYLQEANQSVSRDIARFSDQVRNYGYFLMIHFGALWRKPEMYGDMFTGAYLDHFQFLSERTMRSLKRDLAVSRVRTLHSAAAEAGPAWVDQKQKEIEAALRRCVLRHYSPAERVQNILGPEHAPHPRPALKSLAVLKDEVPGLQHNTAEFDFEGLANHGFVFFYIEPERAEFRASRFGGDDPARISLPIHALEQRNGWVMLNDFLDSEFPTIRADGDGYLISYARTPDSELQEELEAIGRSDPYPSVPAKSPEGRLKKIVHEIGKLYVDIDTRVERLAVWSESARRLSDLRSPAALYAMVATMRMIRSQEDKLKNELEKLDHKKLEDLKRQRREAFTDSLEYYRRVRIHRPGDLVQETSTTHYYGTGIMNSRAEHASTNILVGRDIIPGLAKRCVVELARIEHTRPDVARRLKRMSGGALVRLLLKHLIRPQAMLQREVPFTREDVEFKYP